jgi:hypothetical protein
MKYLSALAVAALLAATAQTPVQQRYPTKDIGVDTLATRRQAQIDAARQFQTFHNFQFIDRVGESGITS